MFPRFYSCSPLLEVSVIHQLKRQLHLQKSLPKMFSVSPQIKYVAAINSQLSPVALARGDAQSPTLCDYPSCKRLKLESLAKLGVYRRRNRNPRQRCRGTLARISSAIIESGSWLRRCEPISACPRRYLPHARLAFSGKLPSTHYAHSANHIILCRHK
jgi:hypothetical protein